MVWFWYFLIYSFLGFLVEVAYVRLVGGVKRDRKCRLVLPICPVYGLGALAILLLPPLVRDSLPLLFPAAALVCPGCFMKRSFGYPFGITPTCPSIWADGYAFCSPCSGGYWPCSSSM